MVGKTLNSSNPFQILEEEDAGKEQAKEAKMRMLIDGTDVNSPLDVMEDDEVEETELGQLYLSCA